MIIENTLNKKLYLIYNPKISQIIHILILYLQLYLLLQYYYLLLLTLADYVVEPHHCTTPMNTDHDHQVLYTDQHHLKLILLPKFLFGI